MKFKVSITLIPDELGNCRFTYQIRAQWGSEKWQTILTEDCQTWYVDSATAAEYAIADSEHFMAGFMRGFFSDGQAHEPIMQKITIDGHSLQVEDYNTILDEYEERQYTK